MSTNNLHLKMLSMISDHRYDDRLSERANKEMILDCYGPLNHDNTTLRREFNTCDIYSIIEFLNEQCRDNKYCSVLVHTGKNESIGGCNVFYIINNNDIMPCVKSLDKKSKVTIYSRQKSTKIILNQFDNYEQKEVYFGGGFRIQVNGVNLLQEQPTLTFLITMSFNNFGSRVLSEAVITNSGPPVKSILYEIPIIDGQITIRSMHKDSLNTISKADHAVLFVIEHLLRDNIVKIDHFLKSLLSLRPAMGIHQLEGMYGVTDKGVPLIEIIDFDGIDVFDIGRHNFDIDLSPQELIFGRQLELTGFLRRRDIGAFSNYLMQESCITKCVSKLKCVDILPRQISEIITKSNNETLVQYFDRLNPYIYAFKILKWVNSLMYTDAIDGLFRYAKYDKKICIYQLNIDGITMAFLLNQGEFLFFDSKDHAREIIMHIFGSKILPVYLSYAREGD